MTNSFVNTSTASRRSTFSGNVTLQEPEHDRQRRQLGVASSIQTTAESYADVEQGATFSGIIGDNSASGIDGGLTINGSVAAVGFGTTAFVAIAPLVISGNNTYTGGTFLQTNAVQLGNFNTAAVATLGTGMLSFANGGILQDDGTPRTVTNNIDMVSTGTFNATGYTSPTFQTLTFGNSLNSGGQSGTFTLTVNGQTVTVTVPSAAPPRRPTSPAIQVGLGPSDGARTRATPGRRQPHRDDHHHFVHRHAGQRGHSEGSSAR